MVTIPRMIDRNMATQQTDKPSLRILLANPRGFCAGVVRAIDIVEEALKKFGAPVYVRHEIVHNRYVVEDLQNKGAVFVKELNECPDDRPVIFSAHGVPKSVPAEAERRNLLYVDATCPLVSKVHREAERNHKDGKTILLIGHRGHPEVVGTMGQLPAGVVQLVETAEDVATLKIDNPDNLAYVTQTTLSVDDTSDIIAELKRRFPTISEPRAQDICYATTNRQQAVKMIAEECDAFIVVGAPNSSNSNRLVEVALKKSVENARLVERAEDINWTNFKDTRTLGLSAGASAPEVLVDSIIDAFRERFNVTVENHIFKEENVTFKLPKILTDESSLTL
jgi:4-hydroxy-3-methylbut-2-enyl diphosphate reductase